MNELFKIRDISIKYDVSARTLRYYEDMGLINSIRGDDYAYRMYDETSVKKLEQILILRKLNISVKDIQRIFNTEGSEMVLEVLGKKIDNIDEEVALLHELKRIVLEFIRQIENADFNNNSDVKLLYEKARDIENRISENSENAKNKILNILPNSQYNSGVIIPINLGSNTLAEYAKLIYRVKSSADVYGKGISVYISDSVDDLNDFMVGNPSEFCLFNHNSLVTSGASGTEWINGEIIFNLTEVQKGLSGQIYMLIGINDMWDMDIGIGVAYQIDNICLCPKEQNLKNILIDFNNYASDSAPFGIIARGGENPPTLTIYDESSYERLLEISEKLKKTPEVRIVELPKCKVATSGEPDREFSKVWKFSDWWKDYDKKRKAAHYAPLDFLFGEDGGLVWWLMVENDATSEDCGGYEIIDFEGGLYAVHTSIDADDTSQRLVNEKINKWLLNTGFMLDESHPKRTYMGHMINPSLEIRQGLGYHQYEIFVPIKLRRAKQMSDVEKVLYTIEHNGIVLDIVGRPDVIWVGTVAYAENNTDEPDKGKLLSSYRELSAAIPKEELINSEWDAAISLNYDCDNAKPKGMMFAQETYSFNQDNRYSLITQPAGLYLRLCNDTAAAGLLGKDKCETYELFGLMKEAVKQHGFAYNSQVSMEIEYHNHNDNNNNNNKYAYIPIINLKIEKETNKMPEIIKTYRQSVPSLRFIGKKYGDNDRVNGTFGAKWGEWFQNGWFEIIEKQIKGNPDETCEDGGAYIGLMRDKHNEPFQYWIGMFAPVDTDVPEGFDYVDFPKSELGICWIYGKESEVYKNEDKCAAKLTEEGKFIIDDENGACWFFERYACPRFTTPDEKGNIILDIGFFIK